MTPHAAGADALPEIWRGGVNAWECDEMGHMNVRFYVARFMEGLQGLARLMGAPDAFAARSGSTLLVEEHHLRFLKEARAGAPLRMTGAVLQMGDSDARLLQVLRHVGDDAPCASALSRVRHVEARSARPFPWPERMRAAMVGLAAELPDFAAPRSLDPGPVASRAGREAADALGLPCAARGSLRPEETDVFGRMRPEVFIGRVSDGVPGLLGPVRAAVRAAAPGVARVGGAVLEYRLLYLAWPGAGDHLELRSGLKAVGEKTQTMVHWMLDPVSGRPWGVSEAVAVNFDLDARKIVPIPPEARTALQGALAPGLSL